MFKGLSPDIRLHTDEQTDKYGHIMWSFSYIAKNAQYVLQMLAFILNDVNQRELLMEM